MDIVNQYFKNTAKAFPDGIRTDWIVCADGFTFSVQASAFHYCTPRIDNADMYTTVEVGYPSHVEDILNDWTAVTDTVNSELSSNRSVIYPYVPIIIVIEVIKKHGGLDIKFAEKWGLTLHNKSYWLHKADENDTSQ